MAHSWPHDNCRKSYINSSTCKVRNALSLGTNIWGISWKQTERYHTLNSLRSNKWNLHVCINYQLYSHSIFPCIFPFTHTIFWNILSKHFHHHLTDKGTEKIWCSLTQGDRAVSWLRLDCKSHQGQSLSKITYAQSYFQNWKSWMLIVNNTLKLCLTCLDPVFHLKKIYCLSEREREMEKERQRSSICWFCLQMPTAGRAGSGWSQKPEPPPGSL